MSNQRVNDVWTEVKRNTYITITDRTTQHRMVTSTVLRAHGPWAAPVLGAEVYVAVEDLRMANVHPTRLDPRREAISRHPPCYRRRSGRASCPLHRFFVAGGQEGRGKLHGGVPVARPALFIVSSSSLLSANAAKKEGENFSIGNDDAASNHGWLGLRRLAAGWWTWRRGRVAVGRCAAAEGPRDMGSWAWRGGHGGEAAWAEPRAAEGPRVRHGVVTVQ